MRNGGGFSQGRHSWRPCGSADPFPGMGFNSDIFQHKSNPRKTEIFAGVRVACPAGFEPTVFRVGV